MEATPTLVQRPQPDAAPLKKKTRNPYQPRINAIRKAIHTEDKRLRQKYTWLKHQNALGMAWFLGSLVGIATTSYLWLTGSIAWYSMMPLVALFSSFLHELEHDLIHDLYFKEMKFVQHIMFAFIWVCKLSANPWWRKPLHLKHHKTSGQIVDIEERLIGLGLPVGLKKLLVTLTPFGAYLVIFQVARDNKVRNSLPGLNVLVASIVNLPILIAAIGCAIGSLFPGQIPEPTYSVMYAVTMILYLPNILRQVSLQFVSTGCHYYGDIPEDNVFFQNQVLNHWVMYPLQLFCFNFGETHIIHHYVTRQPFYLRQMIVPGTMEEFKRQGVRFNDLGIWSRAHSWSGYEGDNIVSPVALGS
eukprot:TRINITY_DN5877_c0_g1_i1.p2 TRINITY_DN5877_c0_g1~~TRINITY_DN5877_c0_g1_i1.p2  ORF type:complete len:358 (-),score=64.91 TRINITY_DN5877_c0_g1_i1:106-1179(-)